MPSFRWCLEEEKKMRWWRRRSWEKRELQHLVFLPIFIREKSSHEEREKLVLLFTLGTVIHVYIVDQLKGKRNSPAKKEDSLQDWLTDRQVTREDSGSKGSITSQDTLLYVCKQTVPPSIHRPTVDSFLSGLLFMTWNWPETGLKVITMYNGIGLTTPRGSGTSGYVQKNMSTVNKSKQKQEYRSEEDINRMEAALNRKPNQEILDHQKKRFIELKCLEERVRLEEKG